MMCECGGLRSQAEWARLFPTPWALLNSVPADAHGVVSPDAGPIPEGWTREQFVELMELLGSLRWMYELVIAGPDAPGAVNLPGVASLLRHRLQQWEQREETWRLDDDGVLRRVPAGVLRLPETLYSIWGSHIAPLVDGLEGASAQTVGECGYCGGVMPRARGGHRYCSDSCRARASQERRGVRKPRPQKGLDAVVFAD